MPPLSSCHWGQRRAESVPVSMACAHQTRWSCVSSKPWFLFDLTAVKENARKWYGGTDFSLPIHPFPPPLLPFPKPASSGPAPHRQLGTRSCRTCRLHSAGSYLLLGGEKPAWWKGEMGEGEGRGGRGESWSRARGGGLPLVEGRGRVLGTPRWFLAWLHGYRRCVHSADLGALQASRWAAGQ